MKQAYLSHIVLKLYLSKQKQAYIEQVELCTKLIPDIDVLLLFLNNIHDISRVP